MPSPDHRTKIDPGTGTAANQSRSAMPRSATVQEVQTQIGRLLAEVEAGESVVITRHGRPVASLSPITERERPIFGSMKGRIGFDETFFDPLPEDELRAWQGL